MARLIPRGRIEYGHGGQSDSWALGSSLGVLANPMPMRFFLTGHWRNGQCSSERFMNPAL